MEAEGVAVGVGAAAPGQHVGFVVALVGQVQRGGEFGGLDLHVEAGVPRHRLHHQRQALRVAGGGRHQREAGVGDTGLLQQRAGALHVALGHGQALHVVRVVRCHPLVAHRGLVVHHHLRQALPVERQLEGFAHAGVTAQRVGLGLVALADVDGDALVADLGDARHLVLLVRHQLLDVGRGHALDEVELARLQVGQPHGGVDDGRVGDLVEADGGLVPVAVEALEHDAVLRHALDELERPRAHRLGAELVTRGLRGLGRHHHAGTVSQRGQQRRERRAEVQPHGHRVDHVDRGQQRQLTSAVGTGHRLVALEVELHGRGVELLAVMESDARAQLHRQRLAVLGPFPAGGQLRLDGQLLVDVEQLVAQRGKHDAADEGARQRRVQHVGVFGQADAKGLGGRSGRDGQQGDRHGGGQQAVKENTHRDNSW